MEMHPLRYYIFFVLLCASPVAFAQSFCDCPNSKAVNDRYDFFVSVWKLDSCEVVVQQLNTKECNVYYHLLLADLSHKKNDLNKMQESLNTGFGLLEQQECGASLYMKYYFLYGLLNAEEDAMDKSAVYFIKSLEAAEQLHDTAYYNASLTNLSAVLNEMKQYERALSYLKKAMYSNTGGNNAWVLSAVCANITESYLQLFKQTNNKVYLDSAGTFSQRSVFYSRKAGNKYGLYFSYALMADLHALYGNYAKSNLYSDSILSVYPRPMQNMLFRAFLKKSENYSQLRKFEAARSYADSSLAYADETSYRVEAHKRLYEVFKELGLHEQALQEYEKMTMLQDSLLSHERTKTITTIEQKYNRVRNEKTIRELNQEKEISVLRIKLLAAILVAIVLILIFYYRQKQLRNKHQLLETQQRLNQARMNPHFFFNTLSSLQTLALTEKDSTRLSGYLSKYARIMRQTLESSYHENISVEEELQFLRYYMELQSLRYPDKFFYEIETDADIDQQEQVIPPMLVQPFIENSIEHGFREIQYKGLIKVHFQLKGDGIQISVEDNGTLAAKPSDKQYPSRATEIVRDRLYLLNEKYRCNASFTFSHTEPRGYKVLIYIPDLRK